MPILPGLILAHVLIGTPYCIRSVLTSLQAFRRIPRRGRPEPGRQPGRTFFLITLPSIRPGLLSGWLFAFIVSFGELNTALFLTGLGYNPAHRDLRVPSVPREPAGHRGGRPRSRSAWSSSLCRHGAAGWPEQRRCGHGDMPRAGGARHGVAGNETAHMGRGRAMREEVGRRAVVERGSLSNSWWTGKVLPAYVGETIAGALTAAGRGSSATARRRAARGASSAASASASTAWWPWRAWGGPELHGGGPARDAREP